MLTIKKGNKTNERHTKMKHSTKDFRIEYEWFETTIDNDTFFGTITNESLRNNP